MIEKLKTTNHKTILYALLFVLIAINVIAFVANQGFVNIPLVSRFSYTSTGDTISPKELQKQLAKKNFVLINVHTPYEGEIVKTDTFIDYDTIVSEKERLPEDKNTPIIVYCKSGSMSTKALQTLNLWVIPMSGTWMAAWMLGRT